MKCEVCKELELLVKASKIEIDTIYGIGVGYLHPGNLMEIKYCPTCGRKLKKEEKE